MAATVFTCTLLLLVAVCAVFPCTCTAAVDDDQQAATIYQADDGTLHINTTASQPVLLNGIDVVKKIAELEGICAVRNQNPTAQPTAEPTSPAPTSPAPTGQPTQVPTVEPVPLQNDGAKIWTRLLGNSSEDYGSGVATDAGQNVYVVGQTGGMLDSRPVVGEEDAFLVKFNSTGGKQWTQVFGVAGYDHALDVAVGRSGLIFVAGRTEGPLAGNGSFVGMADSFLAAFDSDGNQLWVRQTGTPSDEITTACAVDRDDNIFVTGYTSGSLDGKSNAGGIDGFILKFASNGTKLWTRLLGTGQHDYIVDVATDIHGDAYIVGFTSGTFAGTSNAGDSDVLVAKFDKYGAKLWARLYGTVHGDRGIGVAVDSAGWVYVTGFTEGDLPGGGQSNAGGGGLGEADGFVAKYSSAGVRQWTRQIGTAEQDVFYDAAVDTDDNIYVTGRTQGGLDGKTHFGNHDIAVLKYKNDGTKLWSRQLGTSGDDQGASIATDRINNVYVVGRASGNLEGNAGFGSTDAFVSKFGHP